MSEFPSLRFRGVRVLRSSSISIVKVSGCVLAFFSLFIIYNLQGHTHGGAKALTIDGVVPLPSKSPDLRKSVNDGFCPFESCSKDSAFATAATKFRTLCLLSPLNKNRPGPSALQNSEQHAIGNLMPRTDDGAVPSRSEGLLSQRTARGLSRLRRQAFKRQSTETAGCRLQALPACQFR